jgi:ubiquinone/menaquinone biosynthesis C-methylase UbiE
MGVLFDDFYADYDAWYNTAVGKCIDEIETRCAFSLLQPRTGQHILDVCCGTGNFSIKLAKMGCHVTGLDVSNNMLEAAKEKALQQQAAITFINSDCLAAALPEQYDSILSMAGFEFLEDPQSVYNHLMQFLKPNGVLVIGTIQKGGEWEKLYSSGVFKGSVYEHARFLSLEDVHNLGAADLGASEECLFIPPGLGDEEYNIAHENRLKSQHATPGGFICVQFRKNNSFPVN